MHASTSSCSPPLVPGTISCGSKRSSAGRKRSQPRLKLASPSVTSLRGASLRCRTLSRAKGEWPNCSRSGVGKASHALSLRLRATVMGAICSPPMLGCHSASTPAWERSSANSCVREAPPSRRVRTAVRMMRPPSTGTTKMAPKPMLSTTPEVSLLAKRQSEALSTMQSRLSWKPCSTRRSVAYRQLSRSADALAAARRKGSATIIAIFGRSHRLSASRRKASWCSVSCVASARGWQIWMLAGRAALAMPYLA
mmetsp:Transcript_14822/g.35020  ORF Transcript_14822/g.35020 Transcript_14822/m.35020 type:complete len:253 (-) Transcript_14822:25-783(-)